MKFLAMHITNQKYIFDIFEDRNSQNILETYRNVAVLVTTSPGLLSITCIYLNNNKVYFM